MEKEKPAITGDDILEYLSHFGVTGKGHEINDFVTNSYSYEALGLRTLLQILRNSNYVFLNEETYSLGNKTAGVEANLTNTKIKVTLAPNGQDYLNRKKTASSINVTNSNGVILNLNSPNSNISQTYNKEKINELLSKIRHNIENEQTITENARTEALDSLNSVENDIRTNKITQQETLTNIFNISSLVVGSASLIVSLLQYLSGK